MWWAQLLNNVVAQLGTGAGASASSFESIATVTASGGESSLSFSSIPSTYKALQIRGIARDTYSGGVIAGSPLYIQVNGNTGTNYSKHQLYGDSSAVVATGTSSASYMVMDAACALGSNTAGIFGVSIIDFIDYSNTSKNKTMKSLWGVNANAANTNYEIGMSSGAWYNTSAITSISIYGGYSFAAGSTFALYGIKG